MSLIKDLEKLNLNKKEAKLYLALLELGEANLQTIADKAKLKRTTVYDVLDSLKEKGLIRLTSRGKRIYYYAENPKVIELVFQEKINKLQNILPELLAMANLIEKKPKIQFFEASKVLKIFTETRLNIKAKKSLPGNHLRQLPILILIIYGKNMYHKELKIKYGQEDLPQIQKR